MSQFSQLFREAGYDKNAGYDKWIEIVAEKQKELIIGAQLPLSDLDFLEDTRRFDPDDEELHKCSVQRRANYLRDDPPLEYFLAADGGQRVLDAHVFAAADAPPLRFGDAIGPQPTIVITLSVT